MSSLFISHLYYSKWCIFTFIGNTFFTSFYHIVERVLAGMTHHMRLQRTSMCKWCVALWTWVQFLTCMSLHMTLHMILMWLFCANRLVQIMQEKGFSPVWIPICLVNPANIFSSWRKIKFISVYVIMIKLRKYQCYVKFILSVYVMMIKLSKYKC